MRRQAMLSIAVFAVSLWAAPGMGRAQDAGSAKGSPAPESTDARSKSAEQKPLIAYHLDFVISELEEGKRINTRQYGLNLNTNDSNEIKIGTRVPVEAKEGDFQYLDVGTSIFARVGERRDQTELSVRAEISNFAVPEAQERHDSRPVIRQLKISGSTLLQLGKPTIMGIVDDPNSRRQFQLEVTATKLP